MKRRTVYALLVTFAMLPVAFAGNDAPSARCRDLAAGSALPVDDTLPAAGVADPIADIYAAIRWEGPRAYWQSFRRYVHLISGESDPLLLEALATLWRGANVRVLSPFEAFRKGRSVQFTDETPDRYVAVFGEDKLRFRVDRSPLPEDFELVRLSDFSRDPREILQYRLPDPRTAGGVFFGEPVFGVFHEVSTDLRAASGPGLRLALAARLPEDILARRRAGLAVNSVELVHNHPVESFAVTRQGTTEYFTSPLSAEDLFLAHTVQRMLPDVEVTITALVGLRPEHLTRFSYTVPKGAVY